MGKSESFRGFLFSRLGRFGNFFWLLLLLQRGMKDSKSVEDIAQQRVLQVLFGFQSFGRYFSTEGPFKKNQILYFFFLLSSVFLSVWCCNKEEGG